jgi:serine/threonine protein kinase/predicted Zn-dependent protease
MATHCPKCNTENPSDSKYCKECATSLLSFEGAQSSFTKTLETPVEEIKRGTLFADRYEIIEILGIGGMGAVYRVEDTNIGQDIALKLIKPDIASDKKTIERFRNELRTTRMISHRNVCRMFDLAETAGTFYITMEYVSGEDLKSFIRRSGKLDIPKAISIAKEVCEGLAEAHRLGVVHRDLKSNNIMIDKDGNARIMDFGIARSISAKGLTGEGIIIGTPEYMSPEQAEAKEVDQRSDLYSLGVILYEMVTGELPFKGDTPLSIAMKHKGEIPKDPKELNPQIREDFNSLILNCLEKDKEKRNQSAEEVRFELTNIEKGIPTTERAVPERKPFTSKEITVRFNVTKLFIPTLIFVAVVISGLILWKVLPSEKPVVSFSSDKPSLAVVYFMNQTGDDGLDHWREALPSWLITDLSQSKYINVLSPDRLYSILKDLDLLEAKNYASEDLKDVAKEGGVNHIFLARYSKTGDIFRIDYSLQKAGTLEIIASDYVSGKNEESFPSLVDEITKKIKANLALSEEQLSGDIDKDIGAITTRSPEAFRYYSLGRKYLNRWEPRKSIELMEQAVAIDPEFAMAYRSMAMAYFVLEDRKQSKEIYQKALKLTDRLSDRERYQIEADFYLLSENTYDKAIEAYRALLEIYPDALIARINLGYVYALIGNSEKAIEQYEIGIKKYKSDQLMMYSNLIFSSRSLGLYDKARETCQYYLNNFPDNQLIRWRLAQIYCDQAKYELALEEVNKAFALAPTDWNNIRRRGDIYYYMGDLIKAEAEYRMLLEKDERSANYWGMQRLSYVLLIQGKFDDSIEQAKKALELAEELNEKGWMRNRISFFAYMDRITGNPEEALKKLDIYWKSAVEDENLDIQRTALRLKGLTYLEMKQTAEALRVVEELKEMIERAPNKKLIRWYYYLMGMIEIERKKYSKGIEYFEKGLPLLSAVSDWRIIFAESLGQAYYESGDLDKAREEYGRIQNPTTAGRMNYGNIYAKSFYMLGKIYEQQGDTAKAIEHYEKFLDLWKDADPGISEVDNARKRLAGLRGIGKEAYDG